MAKKYTRDIAEKYLSGVNLGNREELEAAAKKIFADEEVKLSGIDVLDWIAEEANEWQLAEIVANAKTLEEVFGAQFDFDYLVGAFFRDSSNWMRLSNRELMEEFCELTGRHESVEEVVAHIDLDEIRESDDDDIGIAGFIELIYDNGGNAEGLIKRLVEVADDLTDEEIDEIISMVMSSYAEIDSSDAEKLYDYIDWEEVKAADQLEEYLDFFKQFAPNLNVAP